MDAERHAQPTGRLCAPFAGHVVQALKLDVSVERSSPRGYAFFVPLGGGESRLRLRPDFHRMLIAYQNRRDRARRFSDGAFNMSEAVTNRFRLKILKSGQGHGSFDRR